MAKEELTTKAGKVEISSRWVRGCWPDQIDKKPTAHAKLTKLVKEFETLKQKRSKTQILIKLTEIAAAAGDMRAQAAKAAKDHKKFVGKFRSQMDDIIGLAIKQKKLIADTGNKSVTVWEKDLADSVKDHLGSKVLQLPGFKMGKRSARLRIPEIVLVELEDRSADTQIYRELDKVHQAIGKGCAAAITKEIGRKTHINDSTVQVIDAAVDAWATKFEKAVKLIPDQVIAKVAIHESIAKAYKRDRRIDMAKAGAGVVISTAAVFAPGTQGLAIAGAVRSGIALGKEIVSYAMNIDQKMTSLNGYLKALDKAYSTAAGKVTGEVALSMLNGALGIDVLPTIKKAKDDFDDLAKNCSLTYSKLQKKEATVVDLMKKLEDYNAKLEKKTIDKAELKKSKVGKKIIKLEKSFDKILEHTHESAKRLNKAETELPKLKKHLDALDKNPTSLKVAAGLAHAAGTLAWSIAGTIDASNVKNHAEMASALFMNSTAIAQDIEDEILANL